MQKRRSHSQNAGFEMSAPIGIGVKISVGGDVSFSRRSPGTHHSLMWNHFCGHNLSKMQNRWIFS
jgi:hypothetical protein